MLEADKLNTSAVTSMYYMFYGCKSLTNITALANWNVFNVTTMSYIFYGCSSLTTLDISRWDTGKVNYASNFLDSCSKLISDFTFLYT